jgi:hypothetical protein
VARKELEAFDFSAICEWLASLKTVRDKEVARHGGQAYKGLREI